MEKWWIIEGPLESRGSAVRTYVTGTCGERARDAVWPNLNSGSLISAPAVA